jgi:chromosome segregation ATPase
MGFIKLTSSENGEPLHIRHDFIDTVQRRSADSDQAVVVLFGNGAWARRVTESVDEVLAMIEAADKPKPIVMEFNSRAQSPYKTESEEVAALRNDLSLATNLGEELRVELESARAEHRKLLESHEALAAEYDRLRALSALRTAELEQKLAEETKLRAMWSRTSTSLETKLGDVTMVKNHIATRLAEAEADAARQLKAKQECHDELEKVRAELNLLKATINTEYEAELRRQLAVACEERDRLKEEALHLRTRDSLSALLSLYAKANDGSKPSEPASIAAAEKVISDRISVLEGLVKASKETIDAVVNSRDQLRWRLEQISEVAKG